MKKDKAYVWIFNEHVFALFMFLYDPWEFFHFSWNFSFHNFSAYLDSLVIFFKFVDFQCAHVKISNFSMAPNSYPLKELYNDVKSALKSNQAGIGRNNEFLCTLS